MSRFLGDKHYPAVMTQVFHATDRLRRSYQDVLGEEVTFQVGLPRQAFMEAVAAARMDGAAIDASATTVEHKGVTWVEIETKPTPMPRDVAAWVIAVDKNQKFTKTIPHFVEDGIALASEPTDPGHEATLLEYNQEAIDRCDCGIAQSALARAKAICMLESNAPEDWACVVAEAETFFVERTELN